MAHRLRHLSSLLLLVFAALAAAFGQQAFDPNQGILLRGTVVTMDSAGTILHNGSVLVRNGKIVAVWNGTTPPKGTVVGNAVNIDLASSGLIFPGLINLHNHPSFNMLELWPAPSSNVQASLGRPLGTEPYANRYQWGNGQGNASPEFQRLVSNPQSVLTSSTGLGLSTEVVKYAEIKGLLGGDTAIEGGPVDSTVDGILIRNVEGSNFGRAQIDAWVPSIDTLSGTDLPNLLTRMQNGQLDAWIVHLSEGVRDSQRRAGDTFSSRSEFFTLASKGLLTDMTVIIHGNGLEADDFAAMRAASSIRLDGSGDGLGAKLVWSPLSNLLLYGQTTLVYHALKAGVVVSLGTDWSPSGSRNLLDELKIADITLRDPRLLGLYRDLIPSLSISGKGADTRETAEIALDRLLVQMVTINPAKAVRWSQEVGSIEAGKFADLLVVSKPDHVSDPNLPDSPYRNLIDATEKDVQLVLVNGEPLSGNVSIMNQLKPGNYEVITSTGSCFQKAIDVTNPAVTLGTETFSQIEKLLRDGLTALGGDNPPLGGGPADDSNTYSYLKANIPGASRLPDFFFLQLLKSFLGVTSTGRLNLERIQLAPPLLEDDDFYFHLLEADVSPATGLIADDSPPFGLYLSNFNQIQPGGNPFTAGAYRDRYFSFCSQ